MSKDTVEAVRALYDAFNRGDLETMQPAFTSDFERFEPESSLFSKGNPYRGFAQTLDGVYKPRAREFDNWKADLQRVLDAGEYIVTTGRYRGRCKATGKDLSTPFVHVLHFAGDGRIDRLEAYTDTLKEAEVAGRVQRIAHVEMPQPVM